ncbi:MAG: type VI secretion system ATPase TssH, partial [Chloroflexota bacterium]
MSSNKFTEKAQEALLAAQQLAESRSHTQLEPEHLLYALVQQEGGVVPAVLSKLGVDPKTVIGRLESILNGFARAQGTVQVYVSNRFRRILEAAASEAQRLQDDYVSTEHFLLAIVDEAERGPGGQMLRELGVTRDRVYQALQEIRGGQRVSSPTPETTYQALQRYGRDLTELARQGKLDPVIGRDEEIRRVIQVL